MITINQFIVDKSIFLTPRVKHIALKVPTDAAFTFIPGQFITIHFEHNGKLLRRSYSIASIPEIDNTIDFAASYVENGPGSEFLFNLKPGDRVQVSGPFGRLILKEEPLQRLFLVATGTGVTPYRAMLPELSKLLKQNEQLQVYILQGAQYRQDLLYPNDFLQWAALTPERAYYRAYLSREILEPSNAPHEYAGYVQSIFTQLSVNPESDVAYLCGNPNMIDQAFADLQAKGMPTSKIRREKYISSK